MQHLVLGLEKNLTFLYNLKKNLQIRNHLFFSEHYQPIVVILVKYSIFLLAAPNLDFSFVRQSLLYHLEFLQE
nr:MAG TPA: hypothetical protein [Bacteriophage sp.]